LILLVYQKTRLNYHGIKLSNQLLKL
jgi:hypothetical protein